MTRRGSVRRPLPRSGKLDRRPQPLSKPAGEPANGEPPDFDIEELQEFLAADGAGVQADPVFKERLRRKLWQLVLSRLRHRGGGPSPS